MSVMQSRAEVEGGFGAMPAKDVDEPHIRRDPVIPALHHHHGSIIHPHSILPYPNKSHPINGASATNEQWTTFSNLNSEKNLLNETKFAVVKNDNGICTAQ
jgi:hypothetical protein